MFSSYLRSCFSLERSVDRKKQTITVQDYEFLRQTRVCFKPSEPLQQPLTPLDLFPFHFRHYLSWALFFDYDINFKRLVEAIHIVAQKYMLLCGRLKTDDDGIYFIEVHFFVSKQLVACCIKVGLKEGKQYGFPVSEMKANIQMAEGILGHGKLTAESAEFPVHPNTMPFYLESLDVDAIHKYLNLFPFFTTRVPL